jgi:choline dehydrogenase
MRVTWDGRRASGVEYARGGERHVAVARREVILAGGAINSPQLLQLSGIGEATLLSGLGIAPLVDAPAVGGNLQDHLAVSYFYKSAVPTLNDELRPFLGKLRAGLRYLFDRRGPLSMSVNQGGGFVRSRADSQRADLQLYFSPVSYIRSSLAERKLLNPDDFPAFLLSFNDCRPTSRGRLQIRSPDPFVHPTIQPNYLATERDVEQVRIGTRLLRDLVATSPLADIVVDELVPGRGIADEAALLADFRARADTVYHPTSTCMMGPSPATSVVDARLRVHGVDGLCVADASIFPNITSGNTNAPTVMVAEKAAAMILADARFGQQ